MPWKNERINKKLNECSNIIEKKMRVLSKAEVFICSSPEIFTAIEEELRAKLISVDQIQFMKKNIFPLLLGKYFVQKDQIWLIEGIGEENSTIIHEMLHSIQVCGFHREDICSYITYKITKDTTAIDKKKLAEWEAIEKQHGFASIRTRFLTKGDCEDF